jgi:alpha-tubulin suppressor-like RCC1 family protein
MGGSRTACLAALALCVGALSLSAPASAGAATVVTGIASGDGGSCAVTSTGAAKCWGLNIDGQLGIGTDEGPQECGSSPDIPVGCSAVPVAVSGLGSGVATLSSGADHTCAVTSASAVKCWGSNSSGQLGVGTDAGPDRCQGPLQQSCSPTPLAVSLPIGVSATAIAAGGGHTCALTAAGGVLCWGDNSSGQLGDGTTTRRTAPVAALLPIGVTATAIAAGAKHTCALTSTGGALCWGMNRFGQLGNATDDGPQKCGADACSPTPVTVQLPGGATATAIAAGNEFTCVLVTAGAVLCWGLNEEGELGNGTDDGPQKCDDDETACSTTPAAVQLPGGVTASAISALADHVCATTSTGGVLCWGSNTWGKLGDGVGRGPEGCGRFERVCSTTPIAVSGLAREVTAVAPGREHTCVLTDIGGVECWGANVNAQLATGDKTPSLDPVIVTGLPGVWELSLSVSGAGAGTVTSVPAGIDCGGPGHTSCSALFQAGSAVQLKASAASGSALAGFAGGSCSMNGPTCTTTMSSERSLVASFALPPSASIAKPAGGGTYAVGEAVATAFSCVEGASGPGLASCNDSSGARTAAGGVGSLATSTAGVHAYTVTTVSKDGLARSSSIAYRVVSEGGPPPDDPPDPPGGPAPPPPTPAPGDLDLSLEADGGSLRKLLRTGRLAVEARVSGAAEVALTGRARLGEGATGRARSKSVAVFKPRTLRFGGAGTSAVELALSRQGRRLLRRVTLPRLSLVILGRAVGSSGEVARSTAPLTLSSDRS